MMNREAIDTWLERAILALVIGVLAFGTLAFGGVRPSEFIVLCWMILAALALWMVRVWIAPRFRFLWPPINWAILPFVGYALWRWRTADIEFVAREEVTQVILGALLFLIFVNNLYGQDSSRILAFALILLGTGVAMYGIYQWMRHSDTVWGLIRPGYQDRASGSYVCPNHLAGFLEMVLPLAVGLAVTGRVSAVLRICLVYAAIVMFVGIAATLSRGGAVAALAGLAFLVWMLLRSKRWRWGALGVIIVVTLAGQWLYSRSVETRAPDELSGHGRQIRLRLWASAWQMWKDNPWWGVGPDHFDYRYRQYREPVDRTQGRPGRAHNDYVNTLADYGAVGLLLILLPVGLGAWGVVRCWPHVQRAGSDFGEKKSNRAALVLGASAGLLALLVHSFFDFNMHIPANAFLAAALLALLASHLRFATERWWFTARWPLALGATIILVAILAALVPAALTRTREVLLLQQAEKLPDGSERKIALLERAFALQPKNAATAYAIGEQLRALAWTGGDDNLARAGQALAWYQRGLALNKWDVMMRIRAGMCLDWLNRPDEAAPHFSKALELDPNHWRTRAMMGWHAFQLERYQEAREWCLKSLQLNWVNNPEARTYLGLSDQKLREPKDPFAP